MKIEHVCIIAKRTAVITCVSNAGGLGPEHTAVIVDGFVYTFERFLAGWTSTARSGWVKMKTADYLDINTHRPLVIQELKPTVDPSLVYEYISVRDYDDADYLSSGVCSQEAMRAISKGAGRTIHTGAWIMNTPYAVARGVKNAGLVKEAYYVFPEEGQSVQQSFVTIALRSNFGSVKKVHSPPVLTW